MKLSQLSNFIIFHQQAFGMEGFALFQSLQQMVPERKINMAHIHRHLVAMEKKLNPFMVQFLCICPSKNFLRPSVRPLAPICTPILP